MHAALVQGYYSLNVWYLEYKKAMYATQLSALSRCSHVNARPSLSSPLLIRSDTTTNPRSGGTLTKFCLLPAAMLFDMEHLSFLVHLPVAAPPKACNLHMSKGYPADLTLNGAVAQWRVQAYTVP